MNHSCGWPVGMSADNKEYERSTTDEIEIMLLPKEHAIKDL